MNKPIRVNKYITREPWGWVGRVLPVKRAGCSSVEVNPRWWRNFISLTYCSWWHKETEERETGDGRDQKRDLSVLKQLTAVKHFQKTTIHQWIDSYLTGRRFLVSASSSSQLVQPDGCDPSWPRLDLWHLAVDKHTYSHIKHTLMWPKVSLPYTCLKVRMISFVWTCLEKCWLNLMVILEPLFCGKLHYITETGVSNFMSNSFMSMRVE